MKLREEQQSQQLMFNGAPLMYPNNFYPMQMMPPNPYAMRNQPFLFPNFYQSPHPMYMGHPHSTYPYPQYPLIG